jgi:PAS domain S-box-containing protein
MSSLSAPASDLEATFVALLQQSHVGIAQTDTQGRFVRVNARWAAMLGYTETELLQLTFREITHPEQATSSHDRFTDLLANPAASNCAFEERYLRKDGSAFWASVTTHILRDDAGVVQGCVATIFDLSQERRAKKLSEGQNEALQLVINGAPCDEVFRRLIAVVEAEDDCVASILFYDAGLHRLKHGAAPRLPDDYNRAVEQITTSADIGTCAAAAVRNEIVITPDLATDPGWRGISHLPLGLGLRAAWSMPIVSATGQVLGTFGTYFRQCRRPTPVEIEMVGVLAKIAALAIERHQFAEILRVAKHKSDHLERLYEAALSTTPDLVYVFDLSHRFTYANHALLAMWGRTWDDAIGKNCLELGYEPWHAAMHDREIEEVIATRRPIRGEVAFTGTGGRRIYDYIFAPVFGPHGEVEAISGTTRDVTEKRKREDATRLLADLAQRLATLGDEQEIIRQTVSTVGRFFNAHRCYFVESLEREDRVVITENWVSDDAPSLAGSLSLSAFGGADWWRACSGGNFSVADTHQSPLLTPATVAHYDATQIRACAVQPIRRTGDRITALVITEKQPRVWTDEELRLLAEVATRAWPFIERARSEAALRIARDEALAASRAKDDFLAALSHELRTPLNPVLLIASEAAENPALPESVRADFETIARNVALEKRLIDDLLDLTGITHHKVVLDLARQDVHALLRQALDNVRAELLQKKLDVIERLDAPASLVMADGVRLQQIFWNLLKNAAKFTPAGGTITIATRLSTEQPNLLVIEVSDTGIGLTAAECEKVFDPFTQGEHASIEGNKPYGGLGLGLAISRQLAELHSGTIGVRSAGRGQGATFTVQLPLVSSPTRSPFAPVSPDGSSAPFRPLPGLRRVLLIEDHEPSRVALARLLSTRQVEVIHAGSAAEALEKAALHSVDLVISDIGLPDGNGYDLMAALKARYGTRGIALSGYGADADIDRSQQAGFLAHLTKPVRIQALEALLAKHGSRQ